MKIVHICLCGLFGEKYAYQDNLLTEYHRRAGHKVTIIAPTMSGFTFNNGVVYDPAGEKMLDNGCKLVRVKPLFKSDRINKHLHLYESIDDLILKEAPDLIFVHNVSSFNYLCLLKVKKKLPNVSIVFDSHMDEFNSNKNYLSKILNGVVYKYLVVARLKKISNIFYGVTPSRCDFLNKVFGVPKEKIKLLCMGADDVNMQFAKREILGKEVRNNYGLSEDDFLIVTGGKIDKTKNIDKLIDAVSRINNPKVKILFFGSITDDLRPYIESMLSERIIYAGWVDSKIVYKYFYAADIVMFPGLHSVLWEQAVASRVPIAVSRLKGFEHVNVNDNCLFLEGNTIEYYKQFVEKLIDNNQIYTKLKVGADGKEADAFFYSHIAQSVIDEVNKLID